MTPSERLHKNDKLWGAVAEVLIAAYALISAGGKLSSYRPFTDVDGKDIVIDLAGGFKDIYIQVKCALDIDRNRRIGGTVRLHRDEVPSSPKFVYVFRLLDRRKIELTRIWVVPSAIFYKRAYRTLLPKGMIQFKFRLSNWRRRPLGRLRSDPKGARSETGPPHQVGHPASKPRRAPGGRRSLA